MKAGTAPVAKGFGPSLGEGGEEGAIIPALQPPQPSALGLSWGGARKRWKSEPLHPEALQTQTPDVNDCPVYPACNLEET